MSQLTLEDRVSRQWWAIADDSVTNVLGYSCAPHNPDFWWCPALRFSLSERHHLFETEKEALTKLIAELEQRIDGITGKLAQLKTRRAAL